MRLTATLQMTPTQRALRTRRRVVQILTEAVGATASAPVLVQEHSARRNAVRVTALGPRWCLVDALGELNVPVELANADIAAYVAYQKRRQGSVEAKRRAIFIDTSVTLVDCKPKQYGVSQRRLVAHLDGRNRYYATGHSLLGAQQQVPRTRNFANDTVVRVVPPDAADPGTTLKLPRIRLNDPFTPLAAVVGSLVYARRATSNGIVSTTLRVVDDSVY